ncbi:MAG: PilN domain-containing protein [Candidatus Doudnabacteria bacterium]
MKIINLLPQDAQKEVTFEFLFGRLFMFWTWLTLSLLVFLGLAVGTRIYLMRSNSQTDDQIAQNMAILNSADYKGLQDKVLALNNSVKEINNLKSHHYYWSNALIALANLTPTTVQLNQIILDRETGRVDIAGQAKTREDVIALWTSIIKSGFFHGINFPLSNLERATTANFTFTFFVNNDKINSP